MEHLCVVHIYSFSHVEGTVGGMTMLHHKRFLIDRKKQLESQGHMYRHSHSEHKVLQR